MGKFIDITGQKFGKLTVLYRVGTLDKQALWHCKCDCGNECDVRSYCLRKGQTTSCGCNAYKIGESTFVDRTNQRYGRLVAIRRVGTKHHEAAWLCRCDCGNEVVVVGGNLAAGITKSCGCLHRDNGVKVGRMTIHGGSNTRLHGVWSGMMGRCYVSTSGSYKHYGARGITVCDEWHDFGVFREWAISTGYDQNAPRGKCTLDRIDNDGNYCPENCRWVDMKVQRHNQRRPCREEYKV